MHPIFTIGHSNHSEEAFLALLKAHDISAVADVRSHPYSRYAPQFSYDAIRSLLKKAGISYVFLGRELGPRSEDPDCYEGDRVSYERLAGTEEFKKGIERLKKGAGTYRIAILCSEKDPILCHRMILICRALKSASLEIFHILEDGRKEPLQDAERRLLKHLKLSEENLFETREALIDRAYRMQGQRIAYQRNAEQEGQP
jgi:uncharacterized protein (DUF488 family)